MQEREISTVIDLARQSLPGMETHLKRIQLTNDARPLHVLVINGNDSSRLLRTPVEELMGKFAPVWHQIDGVVAPLQRQSLDPALTPLGPWRPPKWMRTLGVVTEIKSSQDTATHAFVSRTHAICGRQAFEFSRTLAESESPHGDGWSMLVTDGQLVLKAEIACADYLERTQVPGEARFLTDVRTDAIRDLLPRLHTVNVGMGVNTLIREKVEGASTTSAFPASGLTCALSLLSEHQRWASTGLFHNDLRPWNLIWSGTDARLIDFADAGTLDADVTYLPQAIALAGLIAWLLGMNFSIGADFAAEVRAAAERVLERKLATIGLEPFPWNSELLEQWRPFLHMDGAEAFAHMVTSSENMRTPK